MPVPSYYGGVQQKPSCYDKVSNGFMMGATIGITIGLLFGGLSGFRYYYYILYFSKLLCLYISLNLSFNVGLVLEVENSLPQWEKLCYKVAEHSELLWLLVLVLDAD